MAKTGRLLSLHLLAAILQLVFLLKAVESGGLSVKLVHRHSLDSPFYPGNITRTERILLLVQAASSYASHLSIGMSFGIKTDEKRIRPKMDNQNLMYLVQAGIGTFARPRPPYYKYFLHLDTASDLMWTQCDECRKMGPRGSCFLQKPPLFPAKFSTTYLPLPCNKHPLCFRGRCLNNTCTYTLEYQDGAGTFGYLASESLTFQSEKNKSEIIKGVVFGCGIKNKGFIESSKTNVVTGNFGLGAGEHSFLRQKQSLTRGRFSYCLPPWDLPNKSTIFLRFGADIPPTEGLKVTPLMTKWNSAAYFVNLEGISVGNSRVDIPAKMFARTINGYGGCMVDSGSSVTFMPSFAYQKMKQMLIKNHFSRYHKIKKQGILDICYRFPRKTGLKDLPNITFHLRDADLVFPPHLGFSIILKQHFCLVMLSEDANGMTVIGAKQQANKRFVFDTLNLKLYFGDEDCSRGA